VNVGGEFHKANGGRAHRVAAIIGGGRCCSSGGGRRGAARSGWRGCSGSRRAKIFGAYAHGCAIALNLNLAEPGLMQSLNKHGNEGVKEFAESFSFVRHQLRPRTIALDLIEQVVVDAGWHLLAIHAED
jgi:CobQ-like glutamine amidotransferase family enzyme